MKLYEELMNLAGVSGYENQVRAYVRDFILKFPNYEIGMDNLGSIFAIKKSKNPNAKTLMVAGHMDAVGFMVSGITKNGHLKVQALGGFKPEVLLSQVFDIHINDKEIIKGVIGSLPPHIKEANNVNISELLLDIGAESKEQAISFGVEVGQMVTFPKNFTKTANQNRFISKAVDNRFGVALALEAIEHFSNKEVDVNLIIGATVQEEVGLRGAQTSVNKFKPDMFIALDASPVNDLVEVLNAELGKGFLVRIFDPRNIMHQGLMKYFREIANKNGTPYQHFTSLGGTDAAKALDQLEGVLATTIGLPARYIHSSAAMFDKRDVNAAREMLYNVINDLDNDKIIKIKGGYHD